MLNQTLVFAIHGKISARTRNEEIELSAGSYSVLDIQDYFGYIIKKLVQKLVQKDIINNDYSCKHLFLINHLVNY